MSIRNYTTKFEYTDTFGGEPNYSWVKRGELDHDLLSDSQIVRRVKAELGLTGVRCKREDMGIKLC